MSRAAWIAVLLLAQAGCAASLDVGRARRWLDKPVTPSLPELHESPDSALPAPEGLRASSGELRLVPLRWDPLLAGDVGGYSVERAAQREGPFAPVAAVAGRAHTVWVDTGAGQELGDGQTRFYRVRAFSGAGGLSPAVSEVVAATTAAAPEAPAGLRAYSHQPREVPLSWQPSPDPRVAGYVAERSPTSQGPFEDLVEIKGRHESVYVDRGLGDLRVFHYRVSSVNTAGGRGEPSKPVRAVTKPEPLPPVGLGVTARRLGANELAWDPNVEPDLAGYQLMRVRQGVDKPEFVTKLAAGKTSAVDPAVGADERVSYLLVAFDSDGLVSTTAPPIDVVGVGYDLSATARSDGIHLRWNPRRDEGFRGARVYLHGALGDTELGFAEDGTFVHGAVESGKTYRYTVVLERTEVSRAPTSSPVEITIPRP